MFKNARNPIFNRDGLILIEVDHPEFGWIPFGASKDDTVDYGRQLYERALAGEFGKVREAPDVSIEELEADVRFTRSSLLTSIDSVVKNPLRFAELSAGIVEELTSYRRLLLDVTSQDGFPTEVVWPEKPTILED